MRRTVRNPQRGLRALTLLTGLALLASACAVDNLAPDYAQEAEDDPRAARPDAIVALGDSFISGEGAIDYISPGVRGPDDYEGSAPSDLWGADEDDPYFCHRSPDASVKTVNLWFEETHNLACSGARPFDVMNPHQARPGETAQVDRLRTIAENTDVDAILLGVGANNDEFTFGSILGLCHAAFMVDAAKNFSLTGGVNTNAFTAGLLNLSFYDGLGIASLPEIETIMDNDGCAPSDMPSLDELGGLQSDVEAVIDSIYANMNAAGYDDGDFALVVQTYTSPFGNPADAAFEIHGNNQDDSKQSFRGLAKDRYDAGCPVHWNAFPVGDVVATNLGQMLRNAVDESRQAHPQANILLLDVQRAFDGARLCSTPGSPTGSLANPIWFRDNDGDLRRTLGGTTGSVVLGPIQDWANRANRCANGRYQLCQEAAHPSIAGHAALGLCLEKALIYQGSDDIECRRLSDGELEVRDLA
ncbi:MAG: hypothetical protein AAGD35_06955 [Actinomycetota bacterium]